MINIDRARTALTRAAIQADHYPPYHANSWGKTFDGEWTIDPGLVAEYG